MSNPILDAINKGKQEQAQPPVEAPVIVAPVVEAPPAVVEVITPTPEPIIPPANNEPPVTVKGIEEYNARFKETFNYENVDDFLNSDAAIKVREYDGVKSRLAEIEAENSELYSEYGATKNPFVNESVFKVNALMANHPEIDMPMAVALVSSDFSKMSPQDVLLMNAKLKDPEISESRVALLVAKEFGYDSWAEFKDTDTDLDFIGAKADKAKKELNKFSVAELKMDENAVIPAKIKERIDAQKALTETAYAKIEETWKPAIQHFEANFNEYNIQIESKDATGKLVVENYSKLVLSADDKKRYSAAVNEYVKANRITELNAQTSAQVNNYLDIVISTDKRAKINRIIADKAISDTKLAMEKERFNPSGNGDGTPPVVAPVGNAGKNLLDFIPKPKRL